MDLAAVLRSFVLMFLTEKCYDTFFLEMNFTDAVCLKSALSKGLGVGIIVGSTLVKVPQIVKILQAQSTQGITLSGVVLELFALSSAFAYNYVNQYPFSSWGELIFLLVETGIIGVLIVWFSGQPLGALAFAIVLSGYQMALVTVTPHNILWTMQGVNLPVVIVAKMLQARANWLQGHTGQLSGATLFLLLAGSCARIFTSIQETGDPMLIWTAIAAALANGVLFAQFVYYRGATQRALKQKKKKRN